MTTSNIPDLDQLLAADAVAAQRIVITVQDRNNDLADRARALADRADAINNVHDQHQRHAAIVARLRTQHRDDQLAAVSEELDTIEEEHGKLSGVLNGRPVDPAPAPADPAPQPIVVDPAADPRPVIVVPAPTQVITTPPAAVRERSTYHPRNWTLLAWLLAILGLIAAWWITGANWDKPFHDSWGSFFIWFGSSLVGSSIGGLLGQLIANRQQNTNTGQPVPVQVAPAQPRQVPPPPAPAA
jgi:hypothetical protein